MLRLLWAAALCILSGASGFGITAVWGIGPDAIFGGIAGFFGMAAFLLWRAWPLPRDGG